MYRSHQKQIPKSPYIQVIVSTWSKDSHALYDYESSDNKFYNETFYLTNTTRIYRHITTMRTNLLEQSETKQMPVQNIYIGTLVANKEKPRFKFQSATVSGVQPHPLIREDHPNLFNNSYIVIRDLQDENGYCLSPGNTIRVGRIQYLVLQIRDSRETKVFKQTAHLQINKGTHVAEKNLQGACKICLCEQNTETDPLIAPCKCKGSCQLIHVGCLKNWINSKVKKDTNGVVFTYNFSKFQCEICKTLFPKIIKLQSGQQIDMITIDKPTKPYIIIQSLNEKPEQQHKQQRNLHLITPNEQTALKLGRGHQCEIRITDISVSRNHAQIRFINDKFYLKDLKSKFGTLIKFKQELDIKQKLRIQYGRTVFQFNYRNQKAELQTNQA